MNGLILIDKPAGMSSFDVVRRMRRIASTKKVGHTGTLDPDATGLLPIVLGHCTKLANYLLLDEKEYVFEMKFGEQTDSDDSTGARLKSCPWEHVTKKALERVLDDFRGDILQVPPIFSALKVDGERAYELARRGEQFELPPRPIVVHELELLDVTLPRARLRVRCGSGTYVRSLARDIGEALGSCAHTTVIHRTRVGTFGIDRAYTLEALEALTREEFLATMLSPLEMLASLPFFVASLEQVTALGFGQRIDVDFEASLDDVVVVKSSEDELVAITTVEKVLDGARLRLKPIRVLMAAQ